jgi:hypothetical protein
MSGISVFSDQSACPKGNGSFIFDTTTPRPSFLTLSFLLSRLFLPPFLHILSFFPSLSLLCTLL